MADESKAHLLYVEDDESLSFVTRDNLELNGYRVTYCEDGKKALESIRSGQKFDLCILDVMLPEVDGFTLAEEIRRRDEQVPILFLTAKSMKQDKIHGLTIGADDYITKPFSIEELLLKIDIFLRRSRYAGILKANTPVRIGAYLFDYPNLSLSFGDELPETLTQKEADLLKLFVENKNQVVKRSYILETIWGKDDYFLGRSLDVFISRLRKYMSQDERIKVENIHGVGFKFKVEE
ncbi:MAG: response regulator transcription factor [Saprospiraceae bacterium]|nr:response regulator transcription factor [Saprospiraceae bacterium]